MIQAIETYLAMRRTAGFTLSNAEYLLRSFASFATNQKQTHIRTATVIQWAGQARSVAQRHVRYQTVCLLAQYLGVEDPRHETPPTNYFGYRKVRRVPHIYSCDEIESLVLAAKRLPSFNSLRSETYATLISLLAATGLRISEALHLLVSDITPDGLLIRKTKFQKTRLVPLHDTVVTALAHYLTHRQDMRSGGDHVFVSDDGQPLVYRKVHSVFRTLLKSAGIKPSRGRWPRIHELRHTLQFGHWSRLQLAGNESDSTCWPWLPIWVTSISTPPTGTWKPPLSFCAISLSSPRTLCREDSHDSSRTPHRSLLP
jgi:integrase/recombinase XerD